MGLDLFACRTGFERIEVVENPCDTRSVVDIHANTHAMGRLVPAVLLLSCLISACERWVPLSSVHVARGSEWPQVRYERMLRATEFAGYRVVEEDAEHGRFVVLGFSEERGDDAAVTFFAVQVYADGSAEITPSGHLVKPADGTMHRKVDSELERFLAVLYGN